ncbi:MAG: NADH-quinone oxidoreductase subunit L, partial [Alphaproteobacteria bacterium]|nr:NADH-quinone oxidoreductase subunit L [Alphaproteobacteria bacterium]
MYHLAIFAPFLGFLIIGLMGRVIDDRMSQFITCTLMILSTVFCWFIFSEVIFEHKEARFILFKWIEVGNLSVSWAIKYDSLSTLMLAVVTTVSFLVHVYSIGYMEKDLSIPRFMAYLSLFTFMMLMLISADNLLQLFFGWEGVGLTSYLLIGYWFDHEPANDAAMKAFIVNRVADVGFVLALGIIFMTFGTFDIDYILATASSLQSHTVLMFGFDLPAIEVICIFLLIGAMGKSAQLGLHTWLPDAMEGPTPVSALIHAATMVTAGIYLIVRLSVLFELAPFAREMITVIGALTAFFAASIALTQHDIKRVIAYSTCSQLGYMFVALGVSAYSTAIFHLVTHAFFKALLFLGAGAVIHAFSEEQDMRKMGGVWKEIPLTYVMMWIGSLALVGMPFFAGYYSKELILSSAWLSHSSSGNFALTLTLITIFMTGFYSWRMLWMAFHGQPHADERVMAHLHEAPLTMTLPMLVCAIASIFGGYILTKLSWFNEGAQGFWNKSIALPISFEMISIAPHWIGSTAQLLGGVGILVAILFYSFFMKIPSLITSIFSISYKLIVNKWYFDELYKLIFIRPALQTGLFFARKGDIAVIDGYGPNGAARLVQRGSKYLSRFQSGYIDTYAFMIIVGFTTLMLL